MSFLTRDSRTRLSTDVAALTATLPRSTSRTALENSAKMLSSTSSLNEAQRGRILATHMQLFDENQRLRAIIAATNIGVERIATRLRDGNSARKRSPSGNQSVPNKRQRT